MIQTSCVRTHRSRENSQRGSSGRSYSGMGSSCAELRRVVMRTRGVLEFMEELESADTCRKKDWLITGVWVHTSNKAPRHHQRRICLIDCGTLI